MDIRICAVLILVGLCHMSAVPYSMYVWTKGWGNTEGCTENDFLEWNNPFCFSHTWDTSAKRQMLWDTCNRPGREVDTIFLYDTHAIISRDCSILSWLRETLREGRQQVSNLRIYALFSETGVGVPEQNYVPDVVWYNGNCAADDLEKFDGVAVNNEAYERRWPVADKVTYLDNLYQIKLEADKQSPPGSLKAHYSISWNWGTDHNGQEIEVTWNGQRKPIMQHFIDIFDSVDVQLAAITSDSMEKRMLFAHWDYAQSTGKELHATIFTNKGPAGCQVTFFPFLDDDPSCFTWSHSYKNEDAMFEELDDFEARLPGVKPCLHHYRGGYASGGYPGWPLPPPLGNPIADESY